MVKIQREYNIHGTHVGGVNPDCIVLYCIDAEGVKHAWDLGRVDSNLHHSQKLDGHLTFNCTLNSKKDYNHCFRPVFKTYSAGRTTKAWDPTESEKWTSKFMVLFGILNKQIIWD